MLLYLGTLTRETLVDNFLLTLSSTGLPKKTKINEVKIDII